MFENTKDGCVKMLINSAVKFRIDKGRYKQEYMSSKSESVNYSNFHSQNNKQDIKRPLKINHSDLSFKGLSLGYKQLSKVYDKTQFLEFADKYLGESAKQLFHDVLETNAKRTKKLIYLDPNDTNKIIINKKTIPLLAFDNAVYIFKVLPGDILNGTVNMLGKLPGLKKWSQKTLEKPLFKNIRQRSKIEAKVNALTGMITYKDIKLEEAAKKLGKKVKDLKPDELAKLKEEVENNLSSSVFQNKLKQFDLKSGNYDTKHERALNRLVSGLPPAIFLATDAYNLSRMMDDDSKAADKERKIRFKQEMSRIFTSGFLTLVTMGAFQKYINKSKMGIVLTTGITVLVTEMFSRLANGKHIKRLAPEEARAENQKLNAPEAKIQPISFKAEKNKPQQQNKEQKPLLSFDTLMKASAIILAAGYGIKGFKNLPFVRSSALKYFEKLKINNLERYEKLEIAQTFQKMADGLKKSNPKKYADMNAQELNLKNAVKIFEDKVLYKPFNDLYKKLTVKEFLVEEEQFNKIVDLIKNIDLQLGQKYEEIGKSALKEVKGKRFIDLGQKDKRSKPLVNFIIAPFKFMWNTVTLPYWMIDEKLMGIFRKAKPPKELNDIEALANSFDKMVKFAQSKKMTPEKFQDWLKDNINKGFNSDSLSSISNAELSNLAKTAASIATIWFLMTDNYNMVMLKSNGNDKEGANTKFKERFVQEGSRLFYQTLLIDLFNSTFRNQYNASLFGMSWITLIDTTLGEILTRSSVGTPIEAHTRDELIAIETKQNNATGFLRKYYNFMQRLTGKRSIKSYEVAPQNKPAQKPALTQTEIPSVINNIDKKNILFLQNDNNILQQMIKQG